MANIIELGKGTSSNVALTDNLVYQYPTYSGATATPKRVVQILDTGEICDLPIKTPSNIKSVSATGMGSSLLYSLGVIELSTNQLIATFGTSTSSYAKKITINDSNQISVGNTITLPGITNARSGKIIKIGSDSIIQIAVQNVTNGNVTAQQYTINADGSITAYGNLINLGTISDNSAGICVTEIDPNKWIIGFKGSTYSYTFVILSYDGIAISKGTAAYAYSPTGSGGLVGDLKDICKIDQDRYVFQMANSDVVNRTGAILSFVIYVSGTSLSISVGTLLQSGTTDAIKTTSAVIPMETGKVAVLYPFGTSLFYNIVTFKNNAVYASSANVAYTNASGAVDILNNYGSTIPLRNNRYLMCSDNMPILKISDDTISISCNASQILMPMNISGANYFKVIPISNDRLLAIEGGNSGSGVVRIYNNIFYSKPLGIYEGAGNVRLSGISEIYNNLITNSKYIVSSSGTLSSITNIPVPDATVYGTALSTNKFMISAPYFK